MKRLITTTILALVLLALNASPATAGASVRQRLSADPGVDSIYTIDDNFSMVSSKNGVVENKDFKVVKDFSRDGERYQIIRHREAEPFAYRGGAAPGYNSTEMLADGKFDMKENGYGAADLYEHLYASCIKVEGTPSFVIPVKYDQYKRLTQVAAVDAFTYMVGTETSNGAWFFACDGASRFVVEKDYTFKGISQTVSIRSNRGLEGVSYIKSSREVAELIAYQSRAISAKDEATVLEETAREAATLRTGFIKVHNGVRYAAAFVNTANGCESVEIKKTLSSEDTATAKIYDYEVCLNKVSRLGEKELRTLQGTCTQTLCWSR